MLSKLKFDRIYLDHKVHNLTILRMVDKCLLYKDFTYQIKFLQGRSILVDRYSTCIESLPLNRNSQLGMSHKMLGKDWLDKNQQGTSLEDLLILRTILLVYNSIPLV